MLFCFLTNLLNCINPCFKKGKKTHPVVITFVQCEERPVVAKYEEILILGFDFFWLSFDKHNDTCMLIALPILKLHAICHIHY